MSKKILVTDPIESDAIEYLQSRNYEVDCCYGLSEQDLIEKVKPYDALIVRSTTSVTKEVFHNAPKLKVVGRSGVTVDNIDIDAATEAGVLVCNAANSNTVSTAEHTFALLLACARSVPQASQSMHEHQWARSEYNGVELIDKTIALFGLGKIAKEVALRAKAFGMNVVAYDPYCTVAKASEIGVELYDSLNEILPIADFVSIHLPKNQDTIEMFGPQQFAIMKDGVIIINTAFGNVLNEKSLADFLAAGKIAAAGIDMFPNEPCTDAPYFEFSNVIMTPHLGASTKEAHYRASTQIATYVAEALEGSIVPTALNMQHVSKDTMNILGPYIPACERLGKTLRKLSSTTPHHLILTTAGAIANVKEEPMVLLAAALKGILADEVTSTISPVNATSVARRHDIVVELRTDSDTSLYSSSLTLSLDGLSASSTLSSTAGKTRLVSLMGYKLDLLPGSQALIFEYVDAPGRIGTIGTILGAANINVTTMQIGTKPEEKTALVYMNVEGEVTKEVLQELSNSISALKNMWHLAF